MARRYDPELALADRFKVYLDATLSETLRQASPVVTFYDPMAQDDAHRVVVLIHNCDTQTNDPYSFKAEVEVTVKSQLAQVSLSEDMTAHFDRTNEVREALLRTTLAEGLNTGSVGLGVTYVSPKRTLRTDVREGWAYSEMRMAVACHSRLAADDV